MRQPVLEVLRIATKNVTGWPLFTEVTCPALDLNSKQAPSGMPIHHGLDVGINSEVTRWLLSKLPP